MVCKVFDWDEDIPNKYVVVFSKYQGKLLLSQHKSRSTWETQGGHIEPGETPIEAARRELWEESGAFSFTLDPVCTYWAGDETSGAWGAVFFAEITELGPLPESEMARVQCFDTLPENLLTYPAITPHIFRRIQERF